MPDKNDWRPDWKDQDQYPGKDASPVVWAWEFLRRNPDYQHEYDSFPTEGSADSLMLRHAEISSEFGFSAQYLPDYREPLPQWLIFDNQSAPSMMWWMGKDFGYSGMIPEKPGEVIVRFDLTQPLDVQMKRIKIALQLQQSSLARRGEIKSQSPRNRHILYKRYLQILDADAHKIPIREIAGVIFKSKNNEHPDFIGDQSVRDSLEAAKRLRDGNYRSILYSCKWELPKK